MDGYPLDVITFVVLDTPVTTDNITSAGVGSTRAYLDKIVAERPSALGRYGLRIQCREGTYKNTTSNRCEPCAEGTYSTGIDVDHCTPCRVGQYQDVKGEVYCKVGALINVSLLLMTHPSYHT